MKATRTVPERTLSAVKDAGPRLARFGHDRIRRALEASRHFRSLPAPSRERLAAVATLRHFKGGKVVHYPGHSTKSLLLVLSGGLRVTWPTPDGRRVTIVTIGEGGFYGVGSLVEGALQEAECRTIGDTTVAAIDDRDLRTVEADDANVRALLPKLLAARIQAAAALFTDVVSAPLPQRLARRIVSQALATGRACDDGSVIELRVSQSDLVEMLGSSRSKVNAELRSLERAEVIRLGYRRLFISDFGRLCELAGSGVEPL